MPGAIVEDRIRIELPTLCDTDIHVPRVILG
jgi:hypothetical protein